MIDASSINANKEKHVKIFLLYNNFRWKSISRGPGMRKNDLVLFLLFFFIRRFGSCGLLPSSGEYLIEVNTYFYYNYYYDSFFKCYFQEFYFIKRKLNCMNKFDKIKLNLPFTEKIILKGNRCYN